MHRGELKMFLDVAQDVITTRGYFSYTITGIGLCSSIIISSGSCLNPPVSQLSLFVVASTVGDTKFSFSFFRTCSRFPLCAQWFTSWSSTITSSRSSFHPLIWFSRFSFPTSDSKLSISFCVSRCRLSSCRQLLIWSEKVKLSKGKHCLLINRYCVTGSLEYRSLSITNSDSGSNLILDLPNPNISVNTRPLHSIISLRSRLLFRLFERIPFGYGISSCSLWHKNRQKSPSRN